MKRIKAMNGYTIYQATARDVAKYNVEEGYFYLYFSSDVRDFGLANSDWDWEAGSEQEAIEWASGSNYAAAKEFVESQTTAASYEEIEAIEQRLDAGESILDIEEHQEHEDGCSEEIIIAAFSAGGFCFRPSSWGPCFEAGSCGFPICFSSWEEAYDWISSAQLKDDPGARERVQQVLHTCRN